MVVSGFPLTSQPGYWEGDKAWPLQAAHHPKDETPAPGMSAISLTLLWKWCVRCCLRCSLCFRKRKESSVWSSECGDEKDTYWGSVRTSLFVSSVNLSVSDTIKIKWPWLVQIQANNKIPAIWTKVHIFNPLLMSSYFFSFIKSSHDWSTIWNEIVSCFCLCAQSFNRKESGEPNVTTWEQLPEFFHFLLLYIAIEKLLGVWKAEHECECVNGWMWFVIKSLWAVDEIGSAAQFKAKYFTLLQFFDK